MNILVIDGQGGGVGRQLVENIKRAFPDQTVTAVGTNVLATQAMLRAGADRAATGENAVIYNASRADLILGPIGMIMANGIMGEVSPAVATAVSGADARKILIPSSSCGVRIAGVEEQRLEDQIQWAVQAVREELGL